MTEEIREIISELLKRKNIVIVGHENPDGDSLGSAVSLASFLRRLGRRVTIYQKGKIPAVFSFLGARINREGQINFASKDAIIFIECFLPERSGYKFDDMPEIVTVNIDHHPDNRKYAEFNLVDDKVSSTAEIIYHFFEVQGLPILKNEAAAIFTGIVTDTGLFSQKNATEDAFRIAAELMGRGVQPWRIYSEIYGSQKIERIKLLAATLGTIEIIGGSTAFMFTDRKMFLSAGADYEDSKDFINFARDIAGVEVACYLREYENGKVHINFRSLSRDILPFAKKLGGGGHRLACGATLDGDFYRVKEKIRKDFLKFVNKK
ncbi:MAG: bifunctional oligoribonuclease/PAP phosphatase NrnA [Elusimicrobia bacterium]|nr:bifunctional oligoribonuclease/PAP phosphatase NrnA [Elusimicrobiota bacterium]